MYLDGSRKQILAWVGQGLNDREIGDRLRVSRSTVRYWRERNGVVRPAKGQAQPARGEATPHQHQEKPRRRPPVKAAG